MGESLGSDLEFRGSLSPTFSKRKMNSPSTAGAVGKEASRLADPVLMFVTQGGVHHRTRRDN